MKTKFSRVSLAAAVAIAATGGMAVSAYAGGAERDSAHTRAQAQTMAAQKFDRMDVNKDGKIDAADRQARHAAMFDAIDTDKNGQISREEFAAHRPMHKGRAGMADGEQGEGWRGRGGKGHHGGHHGGGRGWGGGMTMADANKDQAISREEFTASAMQRFDGADANKDGTVTPEERREARKAMRESRRDRMRSDVTSAPAT